MPSEPLLLGIDVGTGGCKACVITASGTVVASAERSIATQRPGAGWAEQDPSAWLDATQQALSQVDATLLRLVEAIGITASTHNAVLLDDLGDVLRPAIMWTDTRSAAEAAELEREAGNRIFELGLQRATPTWTLPQLRWLACHEPGLLGRVHRIMFTKDFVRAALTGDWATDRTDAQGSLLVDARAGQWSSDLCRLIPLDIGTLPPISRATDVAGVVSRDAAARFGLPAGTRVVVGTSDSAAESLAVGIRRAGQAVIKIATAGTVYAFTPEPRPGPSSLTYSYLDGGLWYSCLATVAAAESVRWLRDSVLGGAGLWSYEAMDEAAALVGAGADGVVFHPYLAGERSPHWDPRLCASFAGLSSRHSQGHLIRAVLEGVAFSLRECLDGAERLAGRASELRLTGGGSRSSLWRGILASVLGRPITYFETCDAALGAAMLAGIGVGLYGGYGDAISSCVHEAGVIEPVRGDQVVYDRAFDAYVSIRRALQPIYRAVPQ